MEWKVCASFVFLLVGSFLVTDNGVVSAANAASTCFTMTAALGRGNTLFFFYGPKFIAFSSITRRQRFTGWVKSYFHNLPHPFPIDAAFTPVKTPKIKILISKDKYVVYSSTGRRLSPVKPLSNIFPRSHNFAQGIDAAVTYNHHEYFFKGCTLVVKNMAGTPTVYDMRKLRLPCNINAAWVRRGNLVISKNTSAWLLRGTRRINRKPLCFANSFTTGVNICKC